MNNLIIMRVKEIMDAAHKAAEADKRVNYINVRIEGNEAILTTHVNGLDAAWIKYNASQLDNLIRILQENRRLLV